MESERPVAGMGLHEYISGRERTGGPLSLRSHLKMADNHIHEAESSLGSVLARLGGEGRLDRAGLQEAFLAVGVDTVDQMVLDQIFQQLDEENNGYVTADNLLAIIRSLPDLPPPVPSSPTWGPPPTASCPPWGEFSTSPSQDFGPSSSHSGDCSLKSNSVDVMLFTLIDPSNSGVASTDTLLQYWDSLGVSNGCQVLTELGLSDKAASVDLRHLSQLLNEEIIQSQDIISFPSVTAAIATFQSEVRVLCSSLENLTKERDKLRADLQEASHRTSLLALEIDEQSVRQERSSRELLRAVEERCAEQVREIQQQVEGEREGRQGQLEELHRLTAIREEECQQTEGRLQAELAAALREQKRAETELAAQKSRMEDVESSNISLSIQLLEWTQSQEAGQSSSTIHTEEVEELARRNQELQDRLDELEARLQGGEGERGSSSSSRERDLEGRKSTAATPRSAMTDFRSMKRKGSPLGSPHCPLGSPKAAPETCCSLESPWRSSLESPRLQKLRRRPDFLHSHSLQNELSFHTCLPESGDSSLSSLGEGLQEQEEELTRLRRRVQELERGQGVKEAWPTTCQQTEDQVTSTILRLSQELETKKTSLLQVSEDNRIIRQQLEEQSSLSLGLGRDIQQVTEQKAELESRLNRVLARREEAGGGGRQNVAVISVLGEEEGSGVVTISVNSPETSESGEQRRRGGHRAPPLPRLPPTGPASLPVISSTAPRTAKKEVQVFQLEQHCQNLEEQLDEVKIEIVKIISDKADFSKENAVLKTHQQAFHDLELQNAELRRRLEVGGALEVPADTVEGVKMLPEVDRSSPDGQERELLVPCHSPGAGKMGEEVGRLQGRLEVLEGERRGLEEKAARMEESLELMHSEFESMEDYWQRKLEGERVFYEEQLRSSEAQFRELEARMREYEELVIQMPGSSGGGSEEEDKLSTIEETGSLEVQVTEWEEEIVSLREQLDQQERARQVVEESWRERLGRAEERAREAMERLQEGQGSRPGECECGGGGSLASPRPAVASSPWLPSLLARSSSQSGLDTGGSLPGLPSPRQGPASLPVDINSAQREVRRLQDLRRYIQEECDQLLLRKERLREEVADTVHGEGGDPLDCTLRTVATQAPCSLLGLTRGPSLAINSLAQAYKLVLSDIALEAAAVERELQQGVSGGGAGLDRILFHTLKQRLTNQVNRCSHLQAALTEQKEQAHSILTVMREQHEAEMTELEDLVSSSRALVRKQNRRFLEQVDKLVLADSVIEGLMVDNTRLTGQLALTRDSFRVTDI